MSLLSIYVTANNVKMANFIMDSLERDDMLESAGFTTQDASGNGLLQIASLYGHLEILNILLERGININAVDRNHGTALQAAIYMGHEEVYRELLEWPEEKEISRLRLRNSSDSRQYNVELQTKRSEDTKGKLDVNTKGGYYGCALQVAAYRANSQVVKKLIELGAKVNISGGKYGYPLQAAVRTGSMDVVIPILSQAGIEVNAKGGRYGTVLQAVAKGEYKTRMALPEISRGQVLTQLAKSSDGKAVARVDKDPDAKDYVVVAEELLEHGALLDGGSGVLDNPINAAACSGSREMLKLMLDNFKVKSRRSETWNEEDSDILTKALLTAITRSPKSQKDLVELLVDRGAKIQYVPTAALPNLPLEAAATKNLLEVVKYLLKVRDKYGNYADTLAESGIHGTALRAAIAAAALNPEHEDVVECLINNIAEQWGKRERSPISPVDISPVGSGLSTEVDERSSHQPIRRDTGNKELDWTLRDAEYGNLLQLASFAGLKRTVQWLLQYGADPNVLDTSYRTSLHIAAWSGFPQIVEVLLDNTLAKRADATLKDEWGATPLDQAEESLDREGHPGATEVNLQSVVQILRGELGTTDSEKPGTEFRGPKRSVIIAGKEPKASLESLLAKPVFSMPFWIPGVGFRATIIDFWEADDQECLLLKKPRIEEILYHKAVLDGIMKRPGKPEKGENKLRWIHLPTNNVSIMPSFLSSEECC
jgi:ankyrin repeat protein